MWDDTFLQILKGILNLLIILCIFTVLRPVSRAVNSSRNPLFFSHMWSKQVQTVEADANFDEFECESNVLCVTPQVVKTAVEES